MLREELWGIVIPVAMKMWSCFAFAHFGLSLYIIKKDLSGEWDQYRIAPDDPKNGRISKYLKALPSVIRDLFISLPIIIFGYCYLNYQYLVSERTNIEWALELLIKLPLAYTLGRIWAMWVHKVMHMFPVLYKNIHKEHHVPLRELCALSAWRDKFIEFLLMEIPGAFLLGPYLFKLHWFSHGLMLIYIGIGGAVDHSGFYVNYWMDSRYHYVHHKNPNVNFAELEFLDIACGTWEEFKPMMIGSPTITSPKFTYDQSKETISPSEQ
jgi:sterol desaturase/sphingolipid hydroxylase (fatty acid hydroxylase superfamily)